MPYRISYQRQHSSHRTVHGGDRPATFTTKKAAQNYKERYPTSSEVQKHKFITLRREDKCPLKIRNSIVGT
jgi:hypothetical protein